MQISHNNASYSTQIFRNWLVFHEIHLHCLITQGNSSSIDEMIAHVEMIVNRIKNALYEEKKARRAHTTSLFHAFWQETQIRRKIERLIPILIPGTK